MCCRTEAENDASDAIRSLLLYITSVIGATPTKDGMNALRRPVHAWPHPTTMFNRSAATLFDSAGRHCPDRVASRR